MKRSKYWEQRELKQREALFAKTVKETEDELARVYKTTFHSLEKDIVSLFDQIMAEKDPLPSHLYRYNKYYDLKENIRTELDKLGAKESSILPKKMIDMYVSNSKVLKDQLQLATDPNIERAKEVINDIWCSDGKHWSSRIWTDKSLLAARLEQGLVNCIARGTSHDTFTKEIMDEFSASFHRASTLVRTELTYVQNKSTLDRYKEAGFTEYEILAEKDDRVCELCENEDGKRYPIDFDVLPLHPNCRCAVLAVIEGR